MMFLNKKKKKRKSRALFMQRDEALHREKMV